NQAIGGNGGARGASPTSIVGDGVGGGINVFVNGAAHVFDSTLIGNEAIGGAGRSGANGGNGLGGGINVGASNDPTDHSTLTLSNTTLDHNQAVGGQGGTGGNGGDGLGGGLAIQAGSSAVVSRSRI